MSVGNFKVYVLDNLSKTADAVYEAKTNFEIMQAVGRLLDLIDSEIGKDEREHGIDRP